MCAAHWIIANAIILCHFIWNHLKVRSSIDHFPTCDGRKYNGLSDYGIN